MRFDGNIIDKAIDTTYTLQVNQAGEIVPEVHSNLIKDAVGRFEPHHDVELIPAYIWEEMHQIAVPDYHPPFDAFQSFIFPGGKTFLFSNIEFSDSLDLVAHISYRDPR
jgi:hypothetical protein